jgi:uncharacterized membrane protein YdjX (TVP38/TMEM64 family)
MAELPAEPLTRERPSPIWPRLVVLAILLATVVGIVASDRLHSAVLGLVGAAETIASAHAGLGMVLFVAFSALSAILAFFSTAVLTPVAVAAWGEPVSLLLLWTGWTLGGMCAYAIGSTLGRKAVVGLISAATLERFEDRISRQTPFGLILLFQAALPSEIPGYVLGLARYSFPKYLAALALTELPYAVGTIYLGSSFLERRIGWLIAIAAAGAAFSGWALYRLRKRLSA